MKPTIVVYEDDALRREAFGPHRLMMALAFDVERPKGTSRHRFEAAFRSFPKHGADKVVTMLCDEPPTEAAETARGAAVVALLDSDRLEEMVNRRFKLKTGDVESARIALEQRAQERTGIRTFVRLIDSNIEHVCAILHEIEPDLVRPEVAREALRHDRASRDELLGGASLDGRESLRMALLTRAPLLAAARDCLVDRFREVGLEP